MQVCLVTAGHGDRQRPVCWAGLLGQAGPEDDDLAEGGPVDLQAVAPRAAQPGVSRPQSPAARVQADAARRPRRHVHLGQGDLARDLSLIAEEATETLLPFAEKHGVTIETSGDITPTTGSQALLLQMTTNLVHNAIVHNLPEQGTVRASTSVRPKSVMLTVENTGEKLSPQLVSTLTEPFQRGTERKRNDHAGAGLGLAIVTSITQAHDGTLTITPRTGGGLHVTVQLPATPTHTGRSSACAWSPGPLTAPGKAR